MEATDVVSMNDNLERVTETMKFFKRALSILQQHITLTVGIKSVLFFIAVCDAATFWMTVFVDMGASLLVTASGLRFVQVKTK